jgi:hypothetical protein
LIARRLTTSIDFHAGAAEAIAIIKQCFTVRSLPPSVVGEGPDSTKGTIEPPGLGGAD